MAEWTDTHEQAVSAFAAGRRHRNPHAWSQLLVDDIELRQSLLRNVQVQRLASPGGWLCS